MGQAPASLPRVRGRETSHGVALEGFCHITASGSFWVGSYVRELKVPWKKPVGEAWWAPCKCCGRPCQEGECCCAQENGCHCSVLAWCDRFRAGGGSECSDLCRKQDAASIWILDASPQACP